MSLFQDLLKVDDSEKGGLEKYSQARVYLFASVFVYFITIAIYLSHAFFDIVSDVNVLITIMNSLQTMMLLFASYSLVGKGMSVATIGKRLEAHSKFIPSDKEFKDDDEYDDSHSHEYRNKYNRNRNRNSDPYAINKKPSQEQNVPRRFDDEDNSQELA